MKDDLLEAIEASDPGEASNQLRRRVEQGQEPWEIHLSLFPVVQRVLNPPFINPHLPKMHAICRELVSYLAREDISGLVQLEVVEYARRPKLERLPKAKTPKSPVSFEHIEVAIGKRDREKTAGLMAGFLEQAGTKELTRRLLLLGSGYLDHSLGHSISCTAFILMEMMERKDQDPWPVIATLADYFCKGGFQPSSPLETSMVSSLDEIVDQQLLRATSGRGIVNLHHTITVYAMARVRGFFSKEEYSHMIRAWISFMHKKEVEEIGIQTFRGGAPDDYPLFYEIFSRMEAKPVVASLMAMIDTQDGRRRLGRFLIKALCDHYEGNYNPHYLTGLGSALWVIDRCSKQAPICMNALFQYVGFLFQSLESEA